MPRFDLSDIPKDRRREISKMAAAARKRNHPGPLRKKELKGSRLRLVEEASNRIKNALAAKGMNYRDLSEALDMTPGHVSHLLGGTRNMTLITLADIGDAIGYDVSIILSPKQHDQQPEVH